MKVYVKCSIREIEEARHYSGQIGTGEGTFNFELQLAGSLSQLSRRKPIMDLEGERLVYQLTLDQGGPAINLSDDEFYFFLSLIFSFAMGCYIELLSTRAGRLFPNRIVDMMPGSFGRPFVLGLLESGDVVFMGSEEFSDEICGMLNGPKFDCRIAV
jgi:hypothetical protein